MGGLLYLYGRYAESEHQKKFSNWKHLIALMKVISISEYFKLLYDFTIITLKKEGKYVKINGIIDRT